MKKLTLFAFAAVMVGSIVSCSKEETAPPPPAKVTYSKDIKAILATRCTPCHLAGGTHPSKWDDYATSKGKVTSILDRIQRAPGSTGFMPRGGTAQIPADEIAKIKQWETDGLLEN